MCIRDRFYKIQINVELFGELLISVYLCSIKSNPLEQMVTLSSAVILVIVTCFVAMLFMKPVKK